MAYDDVEKLDDYYEVKTAKTARTASEVSDWISSHGFAPPIILDVQVASAAAEATARSWARVAAPMQPTVAVLGGDACAVARVSHEGAADAYGSLQTCMTVSRQIPIMSKSLAVSYTHLTLPTKA